jgi:hypothetical protein
MSLPRTPNKRATRAQMEVRRIRVLAWLQAGWNYEQIAAHENLSRGRAREIAVEVLKARDEQRLDQRQLIDARLEPAMRLAGKAIIEGKLEGVDRLCKLVALSLKLNGPAKRPVYDENARAKLMAKLNMGYQRVMQEREAEEARKAAENSTPAGPDEKMAS